MNFLAHFLLSMDDADLLTGQFAADHIRGKVYDYLPPTIALGVKLHRFVDDFTDSHPINKELRKHIRPFFGLWSPVAIDLYHDHFLADNWKTYYPTDLQFFAQNCYNTLNSRSTYLPEASKETLHYMVKHDWLSSYNTEEGIGKAFNGLSTRVMNGMPLQRGQEVLQLHKDFLRESFNRFFPELITATKEKLNTFATV